ncbi:putative membrane protein [Wickerhamomyces ciferrii]|uniref:Membrane protein n=1 Tax=Wickerhamomyces ciferrii (strain ATCC 14091 / BCRC 22168 / CBS 111 / JCM 3599 / NBRC 0793 / NRRL Y-1031 F-60-10) TaxID=1206466 RepID=K0KKA2_WICCF|nr:uncharacterized protein BN7_2141 [Wickerhamomyces ciferrii]CCH42597.1 putative membrane protein [Wickerhamomyces ciferrii]
MFSKKRSIPSLVAGLTFATAFGTAGYLLKNNADYGLELALGSSSLLLAAGIARGIPVKFSKPVPIVLTVLGLLALEEFGVVVALVGETFGITNGFEISDDKTKNC